jgi:alkylation response protein AidB-like acyl-CoA dehydrogenase
MPPRNVSTGSRAKSSAVCGRRHCGKIGAAARRTNIDFQLSANQKPVRSAIEGICLRFTDDYWLARDRDGGFPHELHTMMAADGWLGIAMPEAYGSISFAITEAAIMMQAIAESGAGMTGACAVHIDIFGLNPAIDPLLYRREGLGTAEIVLSKRARKVGR